MRSRFGVCQIEDDVAVHDPGPHACRRVLLHTRAARQQIERAVEVIAQSDRYRHADSCST